MTPTDPASAGNQSNWNPSIEVQIGATYVNRSTGMLLQLVSADCDTNLVELASTDKWTGTSEEFSGCFALFSPAKDQPPRSGEGELLKNPNPNPPGELIPLSNIETLTWAGQVLAKLSPATPEGAIPERDLENVKQVLGTLIAWLYSELGENNVKTLLGKLNR